MLRRRLGGMIYLINLIIKMYKGEVWKRNLSYPVGEIE